MLKSKATQIRIQFFNKNVSVLTNPLFRFALLKTGSKEIAEELVQDTFVRLWKMGDKIKTYEKIDGLAFKILRNLCIDHHRKVKFIKEDIEFYIDYQVNHTTPERELELKEEIGSIDKMIKKLPEKQQTVFFLRNVEAYTIKEISIMLDLKLNTVEVILSRARKKMREIIKATK